VGRNEQRRGRRMKPSKEAMDQLDAILAKWAKESNGNG
jgi:hypothetical protein